MNEEEQTLHLALKLSVNTHAVFWQHATHDDVYTANFIVDNCRE